LPSRGTGSDGPHRALLARDFEDLRSDGGSVASEWTLTCLDCDWQHTITATGHPRDGPPDDVEDAATRHKHTSPGDHVVRVAGRVDDDGDDLDPSLLTDGGFVTDGGDSK
jgi:hypothetical protein